MNIKMKNIISISEARSKIFEIAEKVQKLGQIFTFTENGKPKVVMMSADEYENLIEDIELMKNRKFMAKVERAAEEFAKDEYLSWESVKKDLSINTGSLMLADNSKVKYKRGEKKSIDIDKTKNSKKTK